MKPEQKAILDACRIIVENQIKNLRYNYYIDGVITKKSSDGTYNIKTQGIRLKVLRQEQGSLLAKEIQFR